MRARLTGAPGLEIALKKQEESELQGRPLGRRRILRAAAGGAAILIPHGSRAEAAVQVGSVAEIRGDAFAEAHAELGWARFFAGCVVLFFLVIFLGFC